MKKKCLKCDKQLVPTKVRTRTCEYCFITNTRASEHEEWDVGTKMVSPVKISEMSVEDELSD